MARYDIDYTLWSKGDIQRLGDLLNPLMTTLNRCCANDDEERGWLRKFEDDLDDLITDVWKNNLQEEESQR